MQPSADIAIPLPGSPSNGIRGQLGLLSPKLWASQVSQKHQHNLFKKKLMLFLVCMFCLQVCVCALVVICNMDA